ncbi:MAG: L,D-transpeptidase family protein [Rhodobacteraceae bacterium]|nr:L,D-transpeptidase family protein [Paracoccaceae bacterium]
MRRLLLIIALVTLSLGGWLAWSWLGPGPDLPAPANPNARADHILIEKSARRLTAFRDGQVLFATDIALGFAPTGDKRQEGDGKTPEGTFLIDRKNPNSRFHLSLGIDYPQPDDIDRARAQGISPGGDIFIHGQPNELASIITLPGDWTAGCIAVSNDEIETLWAITRIGTAVEIRP